MIRDIAIKIITARNEVWPMGLTKPFTRMWTNMASEPFNDNTGLWMDNRNDGKSDMPLPEHPEETIGPLSESAIQRTAMFWDTNLIRATQLYLMERIEHLESLANKGAVYLNVVQQEFDLGPNPLPQTIEDQYRKYFFKARLVNPDDPDEEHICRQCFQAKTSCFWLQRKWIL